ncbi:MAG: serine/threonine protein kinase [Fibrobacteres bacterium]|nr:serine/threonine protein kinase [Fibrobacterota bacterium]
MMLSEATDTRYDIVKLLGQGASATVYLARHIALGELRVLKILHHDMMMDAKRRNKFKMEAQVSAHLKHPAIVQVFDVTQTTSKLQIEMEYIDGLSLRQYLEKRKSFPLSVSIAIVYAVLEGMEHAHRARLTFGETVLDGVIHRDLKPENIMVRRNGQPVICDFGVAKVGADLMTQTQHISGSVAYMAPERLRGELSTRSIDVFALGVMFFELHKGYRPFSGNNKTQVLENILRWNIVDLDQDWRGSDSAVLQIVRKALAREPANRYQDAGQMLAALRPIYKLYHGDAPPAAVLQDYLTRGQFTTAEFKALLPEETPWRLRIAKAVGVLALGGAAWFAFQALQSGRSKQEATAKSAALNGANAANASASMAAPAQAPAPAAPGTSPAGSPPAAFANGSLQSGSGAIAQDRSAAEEAADRSRAAGIADAERKVKALPQGEQQSGYYAMAKASLREKRDPGRALLLVNKALDYSFHPTIALLKVEILQDQEMFNLADTELARIAPWLRKMTRDNQAQFHWLSAQQQFRRGAEANPRGRAKAKASLKQYLALKPKGSEENLKKAQQLLRSLK